MTSEERSAILSKFVEILSANGIENITTRQLYGAACVGSTIVYDEWKSKEGMIIAAGNYVTEIIVNELRSELFAYASNNVAMGEYFYRTFKKYINEIRFCIQLMSSPNPKYSIPRNKVKDMIFAWCDELADVMGVDAEALRGNFTTFISALYFYCMSEDEDVSRIQRFYLYDLFKYIPKANSAENTDKASANQD